MSTNMLKSFSINFEAEQDLVSYIRRAHWTTAYIFYDQNFFFISLIENKSAAIHFKFKFRIKIHFS